MVTVRRERTKGREVFLLATLLFGTAKGAWENYLEPEVVKSPQKSKVPGWYKRKSEPSYLTFKIKKEDCSDTLTFIGSFKEIHYLLEKLSPFGIL
jgi:hypothetical protein